MNEKLRNEIVRRWQAQTSQRQIARDRVLFWGHSYERGQQCLFFVRDG